jgi:dsRNA-specific ribonuclease
MGILARDTESSAERAQIEILKAFPAWKKLELLDDACKTTQSVVMAGLRARFPELSEEELHRMLMDLVVGEETAKRVWGPRAESGK